MTALQLVLNKAASLVEPVNDCGGCMYQLCTAFGSVIRPYNTAHLAWEASPQHTTACPSYAHFDFYDAIVGGVNDGHVDFHIPSAGYHIANSVHCTTWLNAAHTVGHYANYVSARIGWSETYGVNHGPVIDDGTAIQHNLTADEVKRVAAYLNQRNVAGATKHTTASTTGINVTPGLDSSNYYWEVQATGKVDNVYPQNDLLNGKPGPATYLAEEHYRDITAPPVVVMHTVTFLPYQGATPLTPQEVVSGQQASTPPAPTEDGFTFEGWSSDGINQFDWQTLITADTALVGLWTAVVVPPPIINPPVDPPTTIPTEPTQPTKPVKDNWFVTFIKLIASIWVDLDKKKK